MALPIEDTVISIGWPGLANGGSSAWIATAATFFNCGVDVGRDVDAEFAEHVLQALHGEGRLAGAVAGVVQAHDQAVADQRVAAHAADLGQVLDALGRGRRAHGQRQQSDGGQTQGGGEKLHGDTWKEDQYGDSAELKKRPNQPMALDCAAAPRPP